MTGVGNRSGQAGETGKKIRDEEPKIRETFQKKQTSKRNSKKHSEIRICLPLQLTLRLYLEKDLRRRVATLFLLFLEIYLEKMTPEAMLWCDYECIPYISLLAFQMDRAKCETQ